MSCLDASTAHAKLEGQLENDRNATNRKLFMEILHEVFNCDQMIIAHHLVYSMQEGDYFLVQEIPSADTLIFDHHIMRTLFGDGFTDILKVLACEPTATRDAKLASLYYSREVKK